NAPDVWAQGFTGKGVTVGIVDTGIDYQHANLHDKYRGLNADGSYDNNYNWFDAVNKKTVPYDDNEHGTHVTGTVLGSTADGYHTGMAPDAKYIGSKILNAQGSGTLEGVMKGLQWMLAPTDSAGLNADPTKAPDIISNSWGTNNGKLDTFRALMKSFVAAGIEPVFAAGNAGPKAGSVGAPGSYPEVISIAATDKDDKVASFSSRGPSPMKGDDGSDKKPDVAAPGKDIISSVPGGGYASFSGTSMATPGVSGVIALLLSKYKDLSHAEIVKVLTTSAVDLGTPGYDYDYGYGRVDAKAAMAAADAVVAGRPPVPPATPAPVAG
ncbi:MAG: S8 family serine peptidase, partial [Thermoleophilia bacterium]|nr:S8 family serine peptidase [Thermoleophilia bacterium]